MTERGGWVVGVDIGGTNVVVGLVPDEGGAPRALRVRSTRSLGAPDEVIGHLARIVEDVVADGLAEAGGRREDVARGGDRQSRPARPGRRAW